MEQDRDYEKYYGEQLLPFLKASNALVQAFFDKPGDAIAALISLVARFFIANIKSEEQERLAEEFKRDILAYIANCNDGPPPEDKLLN